MTALILGIVFGASGFACWRLLFPPAPPLSQAMERLQHRTNIPSIVDTRDVTAMLERTLGGTLKRVLADLGVGFDGAEADLRLVGRSLEQHLAQKVLLGFMGLTAPLMFGAMVGMTLSIPLFISLGLACLLFIAPDLSLKGEATQKRDAFRHALSSYLDLVVISLAGGAGVESALRDAALVGRGWGFGQLRNAIDTARVTGATPWATLSQLGQELRIDELIEISASVSIAGTEGARVRESLSVKASSLREHAQSKQEAEAQSSTERMAIPIVALFFGFMVLLGYPAITNIAS